MPVRTETPIGGKYTIDRDGNIAGDGEVLAPVSLSDLFVVYGSPAITGPLVHTSEWVVTGGGLAHFSIFTAERPAEQAAVDTWAALVAADDEATIRQKVADDPRADTMRPLTERKL